MGAEYAILRIQSQFKGFQTRKQLKCTSGVVEKHTAKIVEKSKPTKAVKVLHKHSKQSEELKSKNQEISRVKGKGNEGSKASTKTTSSLANIKKKVEKKDE